MADALAARGLALPALTGAQQAALRAALGPRVGLANPLDYHTHIWGDVDAMAACFAAMLPRHVDLGPRQGRGRGAACALSPSW